MTQRDSLMSADDNRRMFDRIARRYDLLNKVVSLGMDRGWRRKAVAELDPRGGERFLDVGCGTGDMGIEILRRQGGAKVVGIDLAERMLDIARGKVAAAGLADDVSFRIGDAERQAFDAASFDGVVSAFCIRNVAHRALALEQMGRVIRPGGRAVILELTKPRGKLMSVGHRLYNRWVVPLAGRVLSSGQAYRYLVDSIEDFPDPDHITATMEEAGFHDVRRIGLTGGGVTLFVGRIP